ncbi:MAG TPA: DsbA family protein [Candidatus Limnocylindria bacterium]
MTAPTPHLAAEPGSVQVWSDIGCPWAHVAVWRLWDARRRLGLEDRVRFDHRVFPLELFNSEPTPRNELEPEIPICSSLAPRAGWQAWRGPDWTYPVTMLPPMEAVQAAKEQGLTASEALDRGLRRAFWGESRCVSLRHVILEVASETDGLDLAALADALDSGRARRAIFEQWDVAKTDAVQGSPHLFAPDGTNAQNPGLEMEWSQDADGVWLPTILRDDPSAYEDLVRRAAA